MRLDRVTVCRLLDEDGVTREARVLARRDGRALVMVTRDVGRTHVLWLATERLDDQRSG